MDTLSINTQPRTNTPFYHTKLAVWNVDIPP